MKKLLLTCAVLALAPACARTQRLMINTSVPGAQVSIVKRGELRSSGRVAGLVAVGASETFEDQPMGIGTSPLMYEFRVMEPVAGMYLPGISAHQEKICREVAIRAWSNGQYAERVVPVTGEVAEVFLQLTPQTS